MKNNKTLIFVGPSNNYGCNGFQTSVPKLQNWVPYLSPSLLLNWNWISSCPQLVHDHNQNTRDRVYINVIFRLELTTLSLLNIWELASEKNFCCRCVELAKSFYIWKMKCDWLSVTIGVSEIRDSILYTEWNCVN